MESIIELETKKMGDGDDHTCENKRGIESIIFLRKIEGFKDVSSKKKLYGDWNGCTNYYHERAINAGYTKEIKQGQKNISKTWKIKGSLMKYWRKKKEKLESNCLHMRKGFWIF